MAGIFLVIILAAVCVNVSFGNKARHYPHYQDDIGYKFWKIETGKPYLQPRPNEQQRYENYRRNLDYVNQWNGRMTERVRATNYATNASSQIGNPTIFYLRLNKYADFSDVEFKTKRLGLWAMQLTANTADTTSKTPLPDTLDWVKMGVVSDVKDQGTCAASWAFAAVGAVESRLAIRQGSAITLSKQQIADCSYHLGNGACRGGRVDKAFQFIAENNGIFTEDDYPFLGFTSNKCRLSATLPRHGALNFDRPYGVVMSRNESDIIAALQTGPLVVFLEATTLAFQNFGYGIYSENDCETRQETHHALLLVGYGRDLVNDMPYWIVKNSWGKEWGEGGYIRVKRGVNVCGIENYAIYPIFKEEDDADPVEDRKI